MIKCREVYKHNVSEEEVLRASWQALSSLDLLQRTIEGGFKVT